MDSDELNQLQVMSLTGEHWNMLSLLGGRSKPRRRSKMGHGILNPDLNSGDPSKLIVCTNWLLKHVTGLVTRINEHLHRHVKDETLGFLRLSII